MTTTTLLLLLCAPGQPAIASGFPIRPEPCQKVLSAITDAARDLSQLSGTPPTSDQRTAALLKAAARAALKLPREQQAPAFCLALALGLDDSEILRGNFLFGRQLQGIEPNEQRKAREALLGKPTVQGHRDWCQHLVVSAGLAILGGSEAARAAGLLKEQLDARPGGSGFSLADLAADEAGLRLAELLTEDPRRLQLLADRGDLSGLLPDLKALPDGWSLAQIEQKFGGLEDPRFQAELVRIRELVRRRPGLALRP